MTITLLCAGQGTQHADMFRLTGLLPAAQPIFAAAGRLLGHDPRALDSADLHANRTAQILCVTQALAAHRLIADALRAPPILVGYSIGQVAAWAIHGVFDEGAALDLARARADLMNAASGADDGLLFVRGLPRATIDALAAQTASAIAIINPGDAYVVGGDDAALSAFGARALAAGAVRVTRLPIAVASHTARLAAAVAPFRAAIDAHAPVWPRTTGVLLDGLQGSPVFDLQKGLDALARQIAHCIDWEACLTAAAERGTSAFLELGPGHALAEMAASAFPHIPARSLDDFTSLDGLRSWLARG